MLNLLFPQVCSGCDIVLSPLEMVLCLSCRHNLALLIKTEEDLPSLKNRFYGKCPIVYAVALLEYRKKGAVQELIHNLKYRGKEEIGSFLGRWLGAILKEEKRFKEIEGVIPVPLHYKKQRIRGYNQVAKFGQEIAKSLKVPYYDDVLIKVSTTASQVRKNRFLRFAAEEVFTIQNIKKIYNKHVLLVDDVVTTGATIEKCVFQLLHAKGTRISIATMATT